MVMIMMKSILLVLQSAKYENNTIVITTLNYLRHFFTCNNDIMH